MCTSTCIVGGEHDKEGVCVHLYVCTGAACVFAVGGGPGPRPLLSTFPSLVVCAVPPLPQSLFRGGPEAASLFMRAEEGR